jgi:hypothetical protein
MTFGEIYVGVQTVPQGLKPHAGCADRAARLKPCPFETVRLKPCSFKKGHLMPSPFKAVHFSGVA